MKNITLKGLGGKFYLFFSWGYLYFSVGYFFCKKLYNPFTVSSINQGLRFV